MWRACLCVGLLCVGCGIRGPEPQPVQPGQPTVSAIALGDVAEALANAVPVSICDSDQLTLVLDDLVKSKALSATQAEQIKSVLPGLDQVRPLTDADAAAIRAVK